METKSKSIGSAGEFLCNILDRLLLLFASQDTSSHTQTLPRGPCSALSSSNLSLSASIRTPVHLVDGPSEEQSSECVFDRCFPSHAPTSTQNLVAHWGKRENMRPIIPSSPCWLVLFRAEFGARIRRDVLMEWNTGSRWYIHVVWSSTSATN